LRVAGKDVGGEAAAVALAGGVDSVGVDAVLVRERVDHVHGETDIVGLGRRIALPLLVNSFRVGDEHILIVARLGKFRETLLSSWSSRTAVEGEDQAVGLALVIVSREVQEERPLSAVGSGEADLVALSGAAFLELGVESFAAASAGASVCLAEEEAEAKHAESEESD
jgi:hypothetical protein